MENSLHPPQVLQTQRTLPYPPEKIYAAFADPACLAKWWGPNGFTSTFETFDFSVGGKWKFIMHGPDGAHYPNENLFQELEAGRKIVIRHVSAHQFTLTVSLLPGRPGTQIQWVQEFDDPEVAESVRQIVEPCNEQNLDRLHALLQGQV